MFDLPEEIRRSEDNGLSSRILRLGGGGGILIHRHTLTAMLLHTEPRPGRQTRGTLGRRRERERGIQIDGFNEADRNM